MMMRGAFAGDAFARGIRRVPMLFQHDPSGRSASGSSCARIIAGCLPAAELIPEVARGRELLVTTAGRGDRRSVDRLPDVKSAHRSQDPHPPGSTPSTFGKSPLSRFRC